jgi:hypothetical protein
MRVESAKAVGVAVALAACGGETITPVSASFPLGARELRAALGERFAATLTPEDETWPEDAPALEVELKVVRGAIVDVSAAQARLQGREIKTWPATLRIEGGANPLEQVELLGGPADAAGVESEGVELLALGQPLAEGAPLVWTEDGAGWLGRALQGALPLQEGRATFTLFLRGRARVALVPGGALPSGGAESRVVVSVPVRSGS